MYNRALHQYLSGQGSLMALTSVDAKTVESHASAQPQTGHHTRGSPKFTDLCESHRIKGSKSPFDRL